MNKILVFFCIIGVSIFAQNVKVEYVDIKKVFENYEKAKKTEE